MTKLPNRTKSEAGFTLVELAIVMIIIGLLIAGVLKGQQLIGNARVTSTVAQIKAIDAATSTFKDEYQALPGDMPQPVARLPNCNAAPCNNAGNGDGKLANSFNAVPSGENLAFFPQLSSADLVTGIIPTAGSVTFGQNLPQAKLDGVGIIPGNVAAAADLTGNGAVAGSVGFPSGLYLALIPTAAAVTTGSVGMTPSQASRIDAKLDDGVATTGSTIGIGTATCGDNTGYATATTSNVCGIYTRIQG